MATLFSVGKYAAACQDNEPNLASESAQRCTQSPLPTDAWVDPFSLVETLDADRSTEVPKAAFQRHPLGFC